MTPIAVATTPEIADLTEIMKKTALTWKPDFRNPAVDYHNIEATVKSFEYRDIDPREGAPVSLRQIDYTNSSSVEQTTTFKDEVETTAKVGLAVTSGFRYKQEMKGGIKLKEFLEIGGGQEWEISLSTTASFEKSLSQKWTWELPLRVPARKRIVATAFLRSFYVAPEFTALLEIAARRNNYNTGHQTYVYENVSGGDWYRANLDYWVAAFGLPPNFARIDENTFLYRSKGRIQASYGRGVTITVKEYDAGGRLTGSRTYEPSAATGLLESAAGASFAVPELVPEAEVAAMARA